MNEQRMQKLFAAARSERPLEPAEDFTGRVLGAVRREPRRTQTFTVFDELTRLFPRLAFVSGLVIGLGCATELYFSLKGSNSLATDVTEAVEQWRFAAK